MLECLQECCGSLLKQGSKSEESEAIYLAPSQGTIIPPNTDIVDRRNDLKKGDEEAARISKNRQE